MVHAAHIFNDILIVHKVHGSVTMRYEGIRNADVIISASPDRYPLCKGKALASKRFIARFHHTEHSFVRQYLARLDFLL